MNLLDYRSGVIADLRSMLPAKVSVDSHAGALGIADVRAFALPTGAVRVAVLSGSDKTDTDPRLAVRVSAFVLTKNAREGGKDELNLVLSSTIFGIAATQKLGSVRPVQVGYQNMYTPELRDEGIALAAITWTANVDLDPVAGPELAEFLRIYFTTTPTPAVAGVGGIDHVNVRE